MRFLFPVVLVVGVVVMLTSAVASLALSLMLPLILVLAGVAMIASLRAIGAGLQVTRLGFVSLGAALGYVVDVFTLLFVWPDLEQDLRDSAFPSLVARLHPAQFPEVHHLQQRAAAALGRRSVDELWVSPDAALGIGTAKRDGKRIRFLVVGLGLVHALSPGQLYSALVHEFGHERGGDLWLGRWARHLIVRLVVAARSFAWFNPARWAAELSLFAVKLGYLPWSRAKEFAADAWSARVVGPALASEALRTARRELPSVELALALVLRRIEQDRVTPARLGEAVRTIVARIPAHERHRLGMASEGDPLDLGGRTHPPTAHRIAALSKFPPVEAPAFPSIDPARFAAIDEQLTRRWLAGRGTPVDVQQFFAAKPAPPPPPQVEENVAPQPSIAAFDVSEDAPLELDEGYDWRKRG